MIRIETTNNGTYHTLTTEQGRTIEVSTANDLCTVFIGQYGSRRLSYGTTFRSIAEAAQSYKRQDIKSALYALAEA